MKIAHISNNNNNYSISFSARISYGVSPVLDMCLVESGMQ